MARVSRLVGTNDGQLVRHLGQLGKGGTESEPRNGGGDFPVDAAVFRRGGHFGIEEFDVWGAALQKRRTTDLLRMGLPWAMALALASSRPGRVRLPNPRPSPPRAPALRKSRRPKPWQV